MKDLETLLLENEDIAIKILSPEPAEDNCLFPHGGRAKMMQRAEKNASLYDFLDMLAEVVEYSLSDYKVKFLTSEELSVLKDPEIVSNNPYITYKVISRKPKSEYKPIAREEILECDEHGEQRPGTIYGQFFDCIVQFNILASENRVANQVMEKFEELMIAHAGYFKQKGVSDFYFKEQITDSEYNNFRETLSIRNLTYYVQIEKLTVIFNRKINNIETAGEAVQPN